MSTPILRSVFNYLVPSSGTTNAYAVQSPNDSETANFGMISSISGQPFCPSGVMIDNTAGTDAAIVTILPIGFKIKCPAGAQMGMQYPAVLDHTATFTDCENAIVTFVDFPVIPYQFL